MPGDLTDALQRMTEAAASKGSSRVDKSLPTAPPAAPIPSRTGASGPVASVAKKSGGGIASPLTETAYADREWHAPAYVFSADGMMRILIKPLKTLNMTDADGNSVQINFKAPV